MTVSFIGFITKEILPDTVPQIDNITVILSPENTALGEVTVTAYREIFNIKGSVFTANVENSALSKSGRLDDLMNRIPFVTGADNNYEVFGRGRALIYLNGQKVRETSVLKDLLSEDIKKVDVITNPGPRYDSSVRAIIQIYTKPKQGDGMGGSMYSYLQQGHRLSDSENFVFKYRKNNYEWMGAVSHSGTRMKTYSEESNRLTAETISKTDSDLGIDYESNYFTGTVGMNYNKKEKVNAGFPSFFNTGNFINEIVSQSFKHYSGSNLCFDNPMLGLSKDVPKKWLTNIYYSKKNGATQMNLSGDFLLGTRSNLFNYSEKENSVSVETNGQMNYFMSSLIMDFNSTLKNAGQFSYGIESSYSIDRQKFGFNEDHINTNLASNRNKRIQFLLAGYLGWDKTIGILTINGGIRYELIKFDYFQNKIHKDDQSNVYNNIFPTLNLFLKPRKDINITLGYKVTINRPSYYILNDNINYNSRYYFTQGNSLLNPQKQHAITALISIKKILLSTSYDQRYNSFASIKSQYKENEEIILSKPANIPKYETLSLGVSWSDRFGLYSPSVEVNTGKQFFSAEYLGNIKSFNQLFYNLRTNHSLQFPKGYTANLRFSYRSKKQQLFTEMSHQWNSAFQLSKSVKNGLFIQLGINNFFAKPLRTESITTINNVYSSNISDSDIRNVTLLLSYRFNSSRDKYTNRLKSSERSRY